MAYKNVSDMHQVTDGGEGEFNLVILYANFSNFDNIIIKNCEAYFHILFKKTVKNIIYCI